jgi:phosphopentomutase
MFNKAMKLETLERRAAKRLLETQQRKRLLQQRLQEASQKCIAAGGIDDIWAEQLNEAIRRDGNLLK